MDNRTDPKIAPWFRRKVFLIPILIIIALVAAVQIFGLQTLNVEGTGMEPTLTDGGRVLITRTIGKLERGDIVIHYFPPDLSKNVITRIIGLPGETISMDEQGRININGEVLSEPYVSPRHNWRAAEKWSSVMSEWKSIGKNYYFAMGDNRDESNDSRAWGLVPEEYIWGKYIWSY
jgi:signal peptidase I